MYLEEEEKASPYNTFSAEMRNLTSAIQNQAISEGLSSPDDLLYSEHVLPDTPLELLYGGNLPCLRELAAKFDSDKIMTLTGGFLLQIFHRIIMVR